MSHFNSNNFSSGLPLNNQDQTYYNNPSMMAGQNTFQQLNDPYFNNSNNMGLGGGFNNSPPYDVGGMGFGNDENRNPNNFNRLQQTPIQHQQSEPAIPLTDRKGGHDIAQDVLGQSRQRMNIVPVGELVSNQRSQLYTTNDRFVAEQQKMGELRAGSGLLGTNLIMLTEKIHLLNLEEKKTLSNSQMLEKLRIDGVYVRDPQTHQKFTDINMQKLEERILKEMPFTTSLEKNLMAKLPEGQKRTQYFKMNGEIKLHNDLLADEITRPADLAFETTEAYQVKEVNSILSNRLHSFKKRYFRLDIVIGKVCLLKYPQFFSKEDKLAIELRELYKDYERRTSLAMIPFYIDRLKFIEAEQYRKQRNPLSTKEELDFLQSNVEETQRKLDQEKREVQEMAQKLYSKWKEIKEVRKMNGFSSTNVKLKVHKTHTTHGNDQYTTDNFDPSNTNDNTEFYFNLMHEEPSGKKYDGTALPNSEVSRRNSAMGVRAYVRLIINGKYVSRTRKVHVKWPNFEIEIGEQFQVCLFTMPSSIQLELVFGTFKEQLIDVINVEVPGQYVKALTSAASLVKELNFSKLQFDKRRLKKRYDNTLKTPLSQMKDQQKKKLEEEKKKEDLLEQKAIDSDVNGVMYVKAEWKGEGPDMPPMRSENIFKQRKAEKVRLPYTEEEQERMLLRQLYIDVNDPRNERIIRFLKETKNEFLQKLLLEDSKNPLFQTGPFRHMLLEARAKDPDLAKVVIPLLEKEIIENSFLLDKLEILYREQAYRAYLEKKAEDERQNESLSLEEKQQKVFIVENEENAIKYDAECIRRRQIFFDQLKQYQREIKSGHQKASTQYKSVVSEFELLESENPLVALFNKLFITGRKLRPVVQKRQPVSIDSCKEAKIMIHVIKGFNVPTRNSARQDIMSKFKNINNGMGGMQSIGGYGNRPGPFVGGQYDRNMMQSGFNNQFDNRRSFNQTGFGQNYPMSGMQSVTASRMVNGIPLNQSAATFNNENQFKSGLDFRLLNEEQLKSLYKTSRVESLVEVRIVYNEFESEIKITNIAEGDFPEWNEILAFPFFAQNGKRFTKQELISTKTMIYVTLFDREITLSNTGRMIMEQQLRYLGSFSIPLISILNNPPKIDAIFKINRPLALFNYHVAPNSFFFLNGEDQEGQKQNFIPNTYISMSISLDPVLELPIDSQFEYYPGKETSSLLIALTEWTKSIKKKKLEKRNIKCFGENINGQSVLLCRYITPQAPPLDVYDSTSTNSKLDQYAIEKAARYVSLIPFLEDNQAFTDMPDLYCDSQEFIDLGAGDYEEHAILLCNFFNFIDRAQGRPHVQSYLLLGTGFPEGKTAYVMRRDTNTNHVELWNPMKGEAYFYGREETTEKIGCLSVSKGFRMDKRPNDAICQMRSIGCIISHDNIWANSQDYEDPGLVNYNLDDKKSWKPFFTKNNIRKFFPIEKINSIQPEPLQFMRPMDMDRAELIAMKIQSFISEKFENERIYTNKMRTKWNNVMEATLRDILAKCEIKRQKARLGASNSDIGKDKSLAANNIEDVSNQINTIQEEINQNAKGFRAWGFPINVTFVSLQMLWEEVKNTKIHMIYDDDAEFSLYVYVAPYSHNVLSVWFYLLALTKDKRGEFAAY